MGLTSDDLATLSREGLLPVAGRLLAGERVAPLPPAPAPASRSRHVLDAVAEWNAGCRALDAGEAEEARRRFERAAAAVPEGWLYRLSTRAGAHRAQAVRRGGRGPGPAGRLARRPALCGGLRLPGLARGDLERAEAWLRDPASQVLDRDANPLLRLFGTGVTPDVLAGLRGRLGDTFRQRLEETLVVEQYYFVLLWQGRHGTAREYALRMAERLHRARIGPGVWRERAGDACFYAHELLEAREHYREAIRHQSDNGVLMSLYLKLADLAYLAGDVETERALREHYYGALKE